MDEIYFGEVRDYVVVNTSLFKMHIGIDIGTVYFSLYVLLLVGVCSTGIVIYSL
jgi:hypothetical protein